MQSTAATEYSKVFGSVVKPYVSPRHRGKLFDRDDFASISNEPKFVMRLCGEDAIGVVIETKKGLRTKQPREGWKFIAHLVGDGMRGDKARALSAVHPF